MTARRPPFDDVPERRREIMRAVRWRDTAPEMIVRRLLHAMGYRFRLQRRDLPGRPDIVLPSRRAIVDVRGCFWHRHVAPDCRNGAVPKTRQDWWETKLAANVMRDAANEAALRALGWRVLVVWECEAAGDRTRLTARLTAFLGPPGPVPRDDDDRPRREG